MAKGVSLQQISSVLGKAIASKTVAGAIATQGLGKISKLSKEQFGFDFLGLGIRLAMFYGLAFLIEWYMKGKIFIDDVIADPSKQNLIISSFFGVGGIIGNLIFQQFLKEKELNPDKVFTESGIFGNEHVKALFSDKGLKGFKYWDIIKIISVLLVITEWKRHRDLTDSTGGKVSPITHAMFMMFVFAIGLTLVPDLMTKLKVTNFNLDSLR